MCYPTMHEVSVTYSSTGLWFLVLLLFCCGFIYFITIHCTFCTFVIKLGSCRHSPVTHHRTCHNFFPHKRSLFKAALTTPFKPLSPNLLAGTVLRTYYCSHSSLYKLHSSKACFISESWHADGTDRLYHNVGKTFPLYTALQLRRAQLSSTSWSEPKITPQFNRHTTDTATVLYLWSIISTHMVVPINFLSVLPPPLGSCYLPTHQSVLQQIG
jgi:hypothetical protein